MPQNSSNANGIVATIPSLTDSANITQGFDQYHVSLAPAIAAKANLSGAVFTGSVTANIVPTTSTTGRVTVTNTSSTAPGTYTPVGRIFVQSAQPNSAIVQVGDIWMW